ncbi:DUF4468 domain-containing protein [Pseudoxanthomonas suwonensis]|jgi:hypothetical protein|uniref:DUF4468 domain-containing protein n=1 Tax=Pseudoxanthomonas suwonensis TaxID=314722 RepID=UPI00138EDAD7|nr:DUF4468 domain-containing protein [Pseudoxanthomonas suwonensis]
MYLTCARILAAFLLSFLAVADAAQAARPREGGEEVVETFEVPGTPRDRIYAAAKLWALGKLNSSRGAIDFESPEEGILIGNGVIGYPCYSLFACMGKTEWKARFTLRIDVKDGRYRMTFSNLNVMWPASFEDGRGEPAYDGPISRSRDRANLERAFHDLGIELREAILRAPRDADW